MGKKVIQSCRVQVFFRLVLYIHEWRHTYRRTDTKTSNILIILQWMPHYLHRLSPASCAVLSRSLFQQTSVQMFAVQLQRLTLQREPDWAFVAHRSVDQPVTTQFGVGSFFRHWHSLYHSLYHLQAQSHGIQLRVIRTLCWGPNRWRSWWSLGWLHQAGSAAARWARLRRHRLRSAVACPGASSVFIRWRFSRCEILRLRRQNNSRCRHQINAASSPGLLRGGGHWRLLHFNLRLSL